MRVFSFFGAVYLDVAFLWDMKLHHWAIGLRRFETM